jgi:uncharacterized repeat protein (TIGR01451 family)
VEPGTYTVIETVLPEWDLTAIACSDSDSTGSGNTATFKVDPGEVVTCTFTNARKTGQLTVAKDVEPDDASTNWDVQVTGPTPFTDTLTGDDSTDPQVVDTGLYTITETAGTGTVLAHYNATYACSDGTSGTGTSISLNVGEDQVVTCTFTNTRKTGQLEVVKALEPDTDPGRFGLWIDGAIEASEVSDGGTTGKVTVDTGQHTVRETAGFDTSLDDYDSSISCVVAGGGEVASTTGSGPLEVNVGEDDDVVCTITNIRKTALLEVVKALTPDTDSGRFNLLIDDTVERFNASDGDSTGEVTVATGDRTVSETGYSGTDLAAYDTSISCVDQTDTVVISTTGAYSLTVPVNEDDDIVCTITNAAEADLTINQTDEPPIVNAGEQLTYTIQVANGGPAGAQDVVVTDVLSEHVIYHYYQGDGVVCFESTVGTVTCQLGTVEADETVPFDVIGIVRNDADNTITNTVSVASTTHDPDSAHNDDVELTSVEFNPALKLVKEGPESKKVGETVAYGFTVSNDDEAGDGSSIADVTVSDNIVDATYLFGDVDGDDLLDWDESWFFFGSHVVQATDPELLINTATASGLDRDGDDVTTTVSHTTIIEFEPLITVDKTGPAFAILGDTVVYTFTVRNNGVNGDGSDIEGVVVNDSLAGEADFVGGDDGDGVLEVGETWIFNADHTLASTGTVTNTATARGRDRNGDLVRGTDQHSVIVYDASIEVQKTGPARSYVGGLVTYTVSITNTTTPAGAPDLFLHSVIDDRAGDLTTAAASSDCDVLAYREACTFAYPYTIRDGDSDLLTNTVEARYQPLGFTDAITDVASHTLDLFRPLLQVSKAGPEHSEVGDVVTYTVAITNDSSADTPLLSLVSITDSLKGDLTSADNVVTSTCTDTTLDLGDHCQIVYTYTVQHGDSTPLVNTVSVGSQPVGFTNVVTASAEHSMRVTTFVYLPSIVRNYPPPWQKGTGLPAGIEVRTLAVCPTNPDVLYAGFGPNGPPSGLGVFKSINAGRSWFQTGLDEGNVYGIAVAPGCSTVYAAAWNAGVKKSVDGGDSWSSSSDGLAGAWVYSLVIDPLDSDVVYAGTPDRGVYRSLDAAERWSDWGLGSRYVVDLAFAPGGQVLYAATWGDGVFKRVRVGSVWGGWQAVNSGIASAHRHVFALATNHEYPSTVFAATRSGGIYRTLDSGGNWTRVLPTSGEAYDVVVDPGDGDIVYAGTNGEGVYRSTARGDSNSWRPWNAGLGSLVVRALGIGPDSAKYVQAGTGNGAWRRLR